MAVFTLDITVGRGDKAQTHTVTADTDDMPLILMEIGTQESAADIRAALTEFLDVPDEIAKRLTIRHLNSVAEAIGNATKIPNARRPTST
jgi:hypothetical protein